MNKRIEKFKEKLTEDTAHRKEDMAKYAKDMLENPQYFFEWSEKAFEAAARIDVNTRMLHWLLVDEDTPDDATLLANLKEHLTREVMNGAKWPARSTSVASNLAKQTLLAKQTEMLESLESVIGYMAYDAEKAAK